MRARRQGKTPNVRRAALWGALLICEWQSTHRCVAYLPFFDATKEIFTEAEPVFDVAVTVALLLVVYEPATIEKLPVVAPGATVSVAAR